MRHGLTRLMLALRHLRLSFRNRLSLRKRKYAFVLFFRRSALCGIRFFRRIVEQKITDKLARECQLFPFLVAEVCIKTHIGLYSEAYSFELYLNTFLAHTDNRRYLLVAHSKIIIRISAYSFRRRHIDHH